MPVNQNTQRYIEGIVNSLDDDFNAEFFDGETLGAPYTYIIKLEYQNTPYRIGFTKAVIEDFEIAFDKYRNTTYFFTVENNIKFKMYIELGKNGLLPTFKISNEIIGEKREWLKTYRANVKFDKIMTEELSEGLKNIIDVFNLLLRNHSDLDLSDLEHHLKQLEDLYKYYKRYDHLNSDGVEFKSLQYLKAAAVARIIELEHQREKVRITRVSRAINEKIYYIVENLRQEPFLDMEVSNCIATFKEAYSIPGESIKLESLSSGKQTVVDDQTLLESKLEGKRFDVAFSLAHEQYEYVDAVFKELKIIGPHLNVFYYRDEGQEVKLWGRNMVEYLQAIYRDQSDHVIIFVSADYLKKRWARHEWRSVQEAILNREEEYLLPARFDNTKLPGLHETINYVDLSERTPEDFAKMIVTKISSNNGKGHPVYEKINEYLDKLMIQKEIDTKKVKDIFGDIFSEFSLGETSLLTPAIISDNITTDEYWAKRHSHAKGGYFDYLIRQSIKTYSFKYYEKENRKRYLIAHVNNEKPEFTIELHLGKKDNEDIKKIILKSFNALD